MRKRCHILGFFLAFVLAATPAAARIGRGPVMSEDPTVVWEDVWEARFGATYVADAMPEPGRTGIDYLRVPLRIAYGWRERTEVALELPYLAHKAERAANDESGLSDVTAEIKYQMTGDPEDASSASASLLFGRGPDEVIGSGGFLFGIRYRMGRRLFHGEGTLELGYTLFGEASDRFNWGLAYVDHIGGSRLRWSLEALGNAGISPRFEGDVSFLAGVAWPMAPTTEVRAAAGAGVTDEAGDAIVRVDFVKAFGGRAEASFKERSVRWEPAPGPSAAEFIHRGNEALDAANYARAEGLYLRALEIDPNEAAAWNNLGVARYAQGRIAEARDAFARALSLGKEEADVYFNLGLAEYRLGRIAEARRNFVKALEKDPSHALARQNLEALSAPGADL